MAIFEELNKQIRSCVKCGLCKNRTNAVPGEGNPNAEIMLIDGEWQLRTLSPVFEGEEFTISYRDILKNRLIKGDLCQE